MQNSNGRNLTDGLIQQILAGARQAGGAPKRGRRWSPAGQIVQPIDPRTLSSSSRAVVEASGLPYVTRNTRCPCGSWRRFKRCCLELA